GYTLGQELNTYKIVGVTDCEYYFCCGVNESDMDNTVMITILTDGSIEDMEQVLKELGYDVDRKYEMIYDLVDGRESLQKDIIEAIDTSTNIVYLAIVVILTIAIMVVYITYLRDRYNEWCLYCSIGFSRKEIYYSVMRELLITFGVAVVSGAVISLISMVVLDCTLVKSLGLRCNYWYPDTFFGVLCVFAVILALLQIPIRVALYRIRTIDAMDDDLL
ncbi:MAG: ABC transporter permease, partial [Lachnospira sp.]|nr:ABC transporter permease [Lachnospira sp.]